MHFAQSNGDVLSDSRKQIPELGKVAPVELSKGYRTPEGLLVWMLGKNDVLMEAREGLTDSGLMISFRASNILRTYRFKEEITRQATTVDFATHLERVVEDVEFRENSSAYPRTIDRQVPNEFNAKNTLWGVEDTYGE